MTKAKPPVAESLTFDLFCSTVMEKRIIHNERLSLLSHLLKKFIVIVNEAGGGDVHIKVRA